MISRDQFLDFTAASGIASGAEIWKTVSHLTARGVVEPDQVTREAFPDLHPHTLGVYRTALRRAQEAEAALEAGVC